MTTFDHSTIGELLRRHIEGDLDPATEESVADHLRGCAECRREEAGLRTLLAPIERMTASERSTMRSALDAALAPETRPAAQVVRLRRPFLARLAPALGAAALLAIVVVSLTRIDFEGAGVDEDAGGSGTESTEAGAPAAGGAEALDAQIAPVQPVFDPRAGSLRVADLQRLGRTGFPTAPAVENARLEAAADTGADAAQKPKRLGELDAYRDPMLSALAEQAGETIVSECANTVFAGGYARIAPVYGAFGKYDDQRVLILGFLWSNDPRGPLDNYTIWIWPRESCAIALQSLSGIVRR